MGEIAFEITVTFEAQRLEPGERETTPSPSDTIHGETAPMVGRPLGLSTARSAG
jgi:hypothetical protein